MSEILNHKRPLAASLALVAGLALAGCSSANKTVSNERNICTAVGFGSEKGGPGGIVVDVYGILKDGSFASGLTGKVIAGNDTGEAITSPNRFNASGNVINAGEFDLTWDTKSDETQTSTVSVSAAVPGYDQLQVCPDTTMHFNPNSGDIFPTYK